MTGAVAGWIAFLAVPLTALAGWFFRRVARGVFVRRMRPHFVLGYAALGFALVHVFLSMGSMRGAGSTGIWLATLALLALGLQALVGANLQSPGAYRVPLRRWHLAAFMTVAVLASGHVALNSAVFSQFTSGVGDASVVEHPIGLPFRIAQQRLRVLEEPAFAAHAMDGVRSGEVGARAATARVSEETEHAAFVGFNLRGSFGDERGGLVAP